MTTDPIYGLKDVLAFLHTKKMRATYSAVEGVTGIPRRNLGPPLAELGGPNEHTSLVVQSGTGLPSPGADGYRCDESWWHRGLRDLPIIRDGDDLYASMAEWRRTSR